MLIQLAIIIIIICASIQGTYAFSSPSTSSSAGGGINIVGLPGGQTQSLPEMYVNSFRRWMYIIGDKGDENNNNNSIEPIKGAGISSSIPNIEGYVSPTSTTDLWWPRDLQTIQIRPLLNVLFRNGMLSYVSAGLDVRVPHHRSKKDEVGEECDDDDDDGMISSWRNYGLNSQPIAKQWTTLDIAMEKMFHVEGFIVQPNISSGGDDGDDGDDDDDNQNNEQQQQSYSYETLFPSMDNVPNIMSRVACFSAELDTNSPIAEGFHIVSFPMMETWTDLPSTSTSNTDHDGETGEEEDDETIIYKIICLATSEPFGNKLLDMDEGILTMSSTSVLEVDVSRIVGGGESEYLPEPYKSLYLG